MMVLKTIIFLGFVAGITVDLVALFKTKYFIALNNKITHNAKTKTIPVEHDERAYPMLNLIYWFSLILSFFTPIRWFGVAILALWLLKVAVIKKDYVNFIRFDSFISIILLIFALLQITGRFTLFA